MAKNFEFVQEILKEVAKNGRSLGYTAYVVKGHDTFGYIVTPNDNVIGVNKDYFGGVNFDLEYVPSKEHGSGCRCNDEPLFSFDVAVLATLESKGLAFAKRLGAKLYSSSAAWLNKCYWRDSLKEL